MPETRTQEQNTQGDDRRFLNPRGRPDSRPETAYERAAHAKEEGKTGDRRALNPGSASAHGQAAREEEYRRTRDPRVLDPGRASEYTRIAAEKEYRKTGDSRVLNPGSAPRPVPDSGPPHLRNRPVRSPGGTPVLLDEKDPPHLPDRGSGHRPGAAAQQQERGGPAR